MIQRILDTVHPTSKNGGTNFLPWLDGLRGLAILGVIANHFLDMYLRHVGQGFAWRDGERWIGHGKIGVLLFFIVSAYTLFRNSTARNQTDAKPILSFYIRRAFRILPPWWIAVALYAVAYRIPFREHLCCFFMYFGLDGTRPHLHPGAWSLLVEETFYLFGILVFPFLHTMKRALAFLAVTYLIRLAWLGGVSYSEAVQQQISMPLSPPAHWYVFALGIVAFHVVKDRRWEEISSNRTLVSLLGVLSLALIFRRPGRNVWGLDDDIVAFSLTAFFLFCASPLCFLRKLLEAPLLRLFGVCCYSIYLLHLFVMFHYGGVFAAFLAKVGLNQWPKDGLFLVTFPVFALANLVIGLCFFFAIERPCIQLGKRLLNLVNSKPALPTAQTQSAA